MPVRRASVSLKRHPALLARRIILRHEKLVYILVADRKLNYENGRSKVVYIGTTKLGGARIAQSVATRAESILTRHGVMEFEARTVTCRGRQRVKMWRKLERALLLMFKEVFDEIPKCNIHGKNYRETDEFEYFAKSRLKRVLEDVS